MSGRLKLLTGAIVAALLPLVAISPTPAGASGDHGTIRGTVRTEAGYGVELGGSAGVYLVDSIDAGNPLTGEPAYFLGLTGTDGAGDFEMPVPFGSRLLYVIPPESINQFWYGGDYADPSIVPPTPVALGPANPLADIEIVLPMGGFGASITDSDRCAIAGGERHSREYHRRLLPDRSDAARRHLRHRLHLHR